MARSWAQNGDQVFALTRSEDKSRRFQEQGITPLVGDITADHSLPDFPDVDRVLFAVGMDRSRYSDIRQVYVKGLENVLTRLKKVDRFVYLSTTGVFGDTTHEVVTETTPPSPIREGGKASLEAENLLLNNNQIGRLTRLRLAGIYGPDRIPSHKYIQQNELGKLRPIGFLNLVHLDDIVQAIERVDQHPDPSDLYLVSDGAPVWRKDYYEEMNRQMGRPPVEWPEPVEQPTRHSGSKKVSNAKIVDELGFAPRYPTYREGLAELLEIEKYPNRFSDEISK